MVAGGAHSPGDCQTTPTTWSVGECTHVYTRDYCTSVCLLLLSESLLCHSTAVEAFALCCVVLDI